MAPTRSLNVQITGDSRGLGVATRQAEGHMRVLGDASSRMGKTLALGFAGAAAAAGGALVVGLKKSVDAAKDAEASMAKVKVIVDNAGISFDKHAKQIDRVIQAHSRLTGFDDEDLAESFANMVRTTGSLNEAFRLNALAADIARAKGTDLAGAQSLLARVYNGSYNGVKRLGLAIEPVTAAQDKLKASTKNATDEQTRAAKAADKQATSQKAIAQLQKAFGGQAEAYGKTAAGAQERFGVALENVEEKLGAKLLPTLTTVTNAVATFISGIDSGRGAGGRFAAGVTEAFTKVRTFIRTVIDRVRGYLDDHREDIQSVISSLRRFAEFARTVFMETLLPIIRRSIAAIKPILQGLGDFIRGIVRLVSGLLSGNWSKAWDGAKEAVSGAWKAISKIVATQVSNLGQIMKDLGPKLVKLIATGIFNANKAIAEGIAHAIIAAVKAVPGLVAGALKGLGGAITGAINSGFGKLTPFGDGIGMPSGGFTALSGGNSLMGAKSTLAPFASLAGRFGLHTISGFRAGAVTRSGNKSYHASGDAIDESGSPAGMMAFFRFMKARFGPVLRELIYTPGGVGVWNGQPHTYTGQTAADHYDHVHVAFTGGMGDGIGRKRGTGDGIGQAVTAARGAGFRGDALVNMVAIASRESGYKTGAHNYDPPRDDSWGLWQINVLPNANPRFKSWHLTDPNVNARAAKILFDSGGYGPWGGTGISWTHGITSSMFARARAAVAKYTGSSGSGGSGGGVISGGGGGEPVFKTYTTGMRSGSIASGTANTGTLYAGPERHLTSAARAAGTYQGALESIGLARAESEGNTKKTAQLVFKELVLKRRRLDKIKRALKTRLKAATRSRLMQEATELVTDMRALGELAADLTDGTPEGEGPATADTSGPLDALQGRLDDVDLQERAGLIDSNQATALRDHLRTQALSGSFGTLTDHDRLQVMGDLREAMLANTQASGNLTQANSDLANAVKALQDEFKRSNDIADKVQSTDAYQVKKMLADVLSGQLGRGVVGRKFTPGIGVEYSY